jgi:hypothetical protein
MPTSFNLYRVTGTAGNVGTPGAPILHFELLVNSSTGSVSGQAQITQAVNPPLDIDITNVTGTVRKLIFGGKITLSVVLEGTYELRGPPPTQYIILEHFTAQFAVDEQWNGRGGFAYGGHDVNDVPVAGTKSSAIVPMYGVAIHDAAASGDLARMKAVATQAQQYIAQTPEIQKALTELQAEIKKAGG